MTNKYYISTRRRTDGNYTIHREKCPFLPDPGKRIFLGNLQSPQDAIKEGKEYPGRQVCCPFCLKDQKRVKIPVFEEKGGKPGITSSDIMKSAWMSAMFCSVS